MQLIGYITLILFALCLIPILWMDKVDFDIANFTSEWYKGIFSLFQLSIVYIIIEKLQVKQLQNRNEFKKRQCYTEISEIKQNLLGLISIQMESAENSVLILKIKNNSDIHSNLLILRSRMKNFIQNYHETSDINSEYIIILENILDLFDNRTTQADSKKYLQEINKLISWKSDQHPDL